MRTSTIIITLLLAVTGKINSQDPGIDKYLNMLPQEITRPAPGQLAYDVSLKWQNLEALSGSTINCNVLFAEYHINEENEMVTWKDARLGRINNFNEVPVETTDLNALNGFNYRHNTLEFLNSNFFTEIPSELRDLAKWLVSDAIQMQGLAIYVFDSLEFNTAFRPGMLQDYEIVFEDWVKFTSRYQNLVWSAITSHNNEICAVVKFESFYNPVSASTPEMQFRGRSLYYGELWISLADKQVEYAVMFEDVVMNLTGKLFPEGQLVDLQREVIFNKKR